MSDRLAPPAKSDRDAENGYGEFDLIASVFRPLSAAQPFSLGLSDDAAIITPPAGRELTVSTDTLSEGVHFRTADSPEIVAARALCANVSDLAAMGSNPLGYTLAIAAPTGTKRRWFEAFAKQLGIEQTHYGISLLGGDTTRSPGTPENPGALIVTITVIGEAPTGSSVRRSTAQAGDEIWISGTIGDASLGLDVLEGRIKPIKRADRDRLVERFSFPRARIDAAAMLRSHAHAAIDVSDGLIADLGHIARASGLHAQIRRDCVPVSDAVRRLLEQPGAGGEALWRRILGGGDDYEILFTASPNDRAAIEQAAVGLPYAITRIGVLETVEQAGAETPEVTVVGADGARLIIEGAGGYRHFGV